MIEFCGELSDTCKRDIQKKITRTATLSVLVIVVAFLIPIIFLAITMDWIFFIAIPVLALIVIMVSIPQLNAPIKTLNLFLPKKVIIKDEIVSIESEKTSTIRSLTDIKKIIDEGEWYQIVLHLGHRGGYFICQKSLITKGTIEEFETIFKDKIVLKGNKQGRQTAKNDKQGRE